MSELLAGVELLLQDDSKVDAGEFLKGKVRYAVVIVIYIFYRLLGYTSLQDGVVLAVNSHLS